MRPTPAARRAALAVVVALASLVVLGALVALVASDVRVLTVTGASMRPALHEGDLLVVRPVAAGDLRPGDVVVVRAGGAGLLTHRVERVTTDASGGPAVVTKGDANAVADPVAHGPQALLGTVVARLPGVRAASVAAAPRVLAAASTAALVAAAVAAVVAAAVAVTARYRARPLLLGAGALGCVLVTATVAGPLAAGPLVASTQAVFVARSTATADLATAATFPLMSTFAGSPTRAGPATGVAMTPKNLALRGAELLVADAGNHLLRSVDLGTSQSTVLAGTGTPGYDVSEDGGPASAARLNDPQDVVVGPAGELYVADTGNSCIRRISTAGVVTTVAGTCGTSGFAGDGGPATAARLNRPRAVAVAGDGTLYVADSENRRVRLVGTDGTITTVAGNGASPAACGVEAQAGVSPPTSAPLGTVEDVALQGGRIWVVVPHRVLTFDLGGTVSAFFATQCAGALNNPKSLAFDPVGGEVYVSNQSIIGIRRITAAGASAGQYVGRHTLGLAVAPDGTIYLGEAFANTGASSVRRCTVPCSTTVVVAGNGQGYSSGDGGPATSAQLGTDVTDAGGSQLARGPAGVYVAEPQNQRVRLVAADGTISTVAGTGTRGFSGSGGPAVGARLDGPRGVAVDAAGNLLVADSNNHRIRRVLAATGVIEDVAGTGTAGSTDSATATSATLNAPSALAVAADGSVYVADTGGHRIRRFTVGGAMTTVAGTGTAGAGGDGGPATAAQLSSPSGLALAADGTLLVADTGNHRVRSLSPGGTLSTLAGSGTPGFQGDHGPAVTARLTGPTAVAVTPAGVVLVADTGNHRVREVSTSGTITTRAGTGSAAYGGDGLAPRGADLLRPSGLALHPSGDLLVADLGNRRVRRAG